MTTLTKTSNLIGKKVLTLKTGEEIAKVRDIVFDPASLRIQYLVTDEGGWFSQAKIIPFTKVRVVGEDRVMVENNTAEIPMNIVSESVKSVIQNDENIKNADVVTQDGTKLGRLKDLIFDRETGIIQKVEVAQGLFTTITSGSNELQSRNIDKIGADAIIVSPHTRKIVEHQDEEQGTNRLINSAKDRVKHAKHAVSEELHETQNKTQEMISMAETKISKSVHDIKKNLKEEKAKINNSKNNDDIISSTKESIQSATNTIKNTAQDSFDKAKHAVKEKRKQEALGSTLTRDVRSTQDSSLIAKKGDFVDQELINKAESNQVLDQVLNYSE